MNKFKQAVFTSLIFAALNLASPAAIVHPGGWHTAADIQRVRHQIAAHAEPWSSAKDKLMATGPNDDYKPSAVATVTRGGGGIDQGGNSALQRDASNAYTLMIKWLVGCPDRDQRRRCSTRGRHLRQQIRPGVGTGGLLQTGLAE
jgi:hypothetical protein